MYFFKFLSSKWKNYIFVFLNYMVQNNLYFSFYIPIFIFYYSQTTVNCMNRPNFISCKLSLTFYRNLNVGQSFINIINKRVLYSIIYFQYRILMKRRKIILSYFPLDQDLKWYILFCQNVKRVYFSPYFTDLPQDSLYICISVIV